MPGSPQLYRLRDTIVDPSRNCLVRDGGEHYLRHKTFRTLLYLIEHRERSISKEELFREVWEGAVVSDGSLVQCIREIRHALGDDPQHPQFIKTLPKVGYRFVGPVLSGEPDDAAESDAVPVDSVGSAVSRIEGRTVWTTDGHRRRRTAVWVAAVAVGVIALVSALVWTRDHAAASPGGTPLVVAVLPFNNLSSDKKLDWLRDGLPDMLITGLARSRALAVVGRPQLAEVMDRIDKGPRTSVSLDLAVETARRTRSHVVVSGSFARVDRTIRIDVQLFDVTSGALRGAQSLTVTEADLLTDVDVLSLRVASDLGAPPRGGDRARLSDVMTPNLEAYRAYLLALEKAHAYNSTEALQLLETAIRLDPRFAMAYARIGYIYTVVRVNERDRAIPYLEKAFTLTDRLSDKDRLYIDAWNALARNRLEEAIGTLRKVVDAYPMETEAYWRLAQSLIYVQRLPEAIAAFERGLAVDPERKEIWNALGFGYSQLGTYDRAIAAHERYVALDPAEANAYDSLGLTYGQAGRYADALEAFDRALSLRPDFHFAVAHKGDVFFQLGRYREALAHYQRYLELAPSDWDRAMAYNHIAIVHWRRGNLQAALDAARHEDRVGNDFGTELKLALAQGDLSTADRLAQRHFGTPSTPARGSKLTSRDPHYLRGLLAQKHGRGQEALDHFAKALEIAHTQWGINSLEDILAAAYVELGRLDAAAAEYRRLVSRNPHDALTRYNLARVYEQQGRHADARDEYAAFLKIWKDADDDLPQVRHARERLNGTS